MNRTPLLTCHEVMDDIFSTASQVEFTKSQPDKMLSRGCMSKARHPKPYNKGPRKQMTDDWKRRVVERLEENKLTGKQPANMDQLAATVGAKKGGLNRTFDMHQRPPQTASSYVDKICEVLGIGPPLQELSRDDERDIDAFLVFSPELRRRLLDMGGQMIKKKT